MTGGAGVHPDFFPAGGEGSLLEKHVKVQSMTEPLTKLTCKRLSHNQCPETETHAIEMLSHLLDSASFYLVTS